MIIQTADQKLLIRELSPLSPKSDQCQISLCNNYHCFIKQSEHEN